MTKKNIVTLSEDEATLLAICFANYRWAIVEYDRDTSAAVNDNVVMSGTALLAVQRITGVEIAKPALIEKFIANIRNEALGDGT